MIGILPEAQDWQTKLTDGRTVSVGFFNYGEGGNLNCVLQKTASNGGDTASDFELIHSWNDVHTVLTPTNVEEVLGRFVDESNVKLAVVLGGNKPVIPTDVWERLKWHFRWSLSFNTSTNKIVFKKP